ncbi:Hypp9126 [Branchiostoma lanceolatum]|uniref:Hypp9126 protein n=1 Tax=Branchiostoma lanceolatum TaxID=7740 RepID=A0A8J9ZBY1_BRALA|nr:Hypp9126 [Branchiostoma lanceolatum]CAH1251695.1 Hypp9126 [Branchiostoma lanceolatum]
MSRGLALVVLLGLVGIISAQGKWKAATKKGCYKGTIDSKDVKISGDDITNPGCSEYCWEQKKPYSATTGQDCGCGSEDEIKKLDPADDSSCTTPCAGNSKEMCGGVGFMSVWKAEGGKKRGMAEKLEEVNGRLRELIAKREMAEEMEEMEEQLRELEAKLSR